MEQQDKIRILLDMQEHPEQYSDEQLQKMSEGDAELAELLEEISMAKQVFAKREAEEEDIPMDDLWQKFASDHAEELINLDAEKQSKAKSGFSFRKIAAIFVGGILITSIAYATAISLGIVNNPSSLSKEEQAVETSNDTINNKVSTVNNDTIPQTPKTEPKVISFDNKELPVILSAMAEYYHVEVTYANEEAKSIRLLFEWDQKKSLDDNLVLLNSFQQININREGNKLTVD